ncbi:MAG: tRNA (guanosine(37)-N1)-methyltransferase TrmD [Candidatus Kerfeldbacteria bacterium RIFOXYA2_FULL_38_24]|uniref:tRNA (guanine-N(1)-)-methyltransferase n=1 Tax=Candidatus Kerfeldbacteria bacterium RIFOXYB2_FULL_38_14 TaxID=1798547 RepID=A0A1G2BGT9_9BACT|nr:MAG: tRNA (guanosine(37)-N1)-methyltransferase TrmD [Candidatus Kerfeldbacteria bacterium RIFOXYA2_FULL_38_24]OGY87500.1 MAG: tRNA (guanosine(37)-N1)-methyltransferase TrmD [Candidatus Kerfeldbacteria bacterium RIFOXYB2_FULL_38_14]OGY90236.1 MAG: tRNA (guanosine(37)-N1)-methyltransferase TrmD [Candidatus Kerfeldbacteria bacterium RIFOXYC2_FULL_38_9]
MYRFDVITIFPEMLNSVLNASILQRAQKSKKIGVRFHNPRDKSTDKHKTVDDTPYGGGPGMVMKIMPLARTIKAIRKRKKHRIILLSAKGARFNQKKAQELSQKYNHLIFVCGRYEGVDERIKYYIDEEISIGDFVLTGGELGSAVIIDAVSRLVPGVLGHTESNQDESHSTPGYLEYPHYTRPEVFDGHTVPKILLSGNHPEIAEWRKKQSKKT